MYEVKPYHGDRPCEMERVEEGPNGPESHHCHEQATSVMYQGLEDTAGATICQAHLDWLLGNIEEKVERHGIFCR